MGQAWASAIQIGSRFGVLSCYSLSPGADMGLWDASTELREIRVVQAKRKEAQYAGFWWAVSESWSRAFFSFSAEIDTAVRLVRRN